MDLPPPPLLRHHHHHHDHLRYGNFLQPPNFTPAHYNLSPQPPPQLHPHLPPPPPPPQLHPHPPPHSFLSPPPPVPPPRTMPSQRFTFFPPHHSIQDRSNRHEIDAPTKSYFHREFLPPPPLPPPPPRGNLVSRVVNDYPQRDPITKDEFLNQGYSDNFCHDLSKIGNRNLQFGAREVNSRTLDIGDHERYHRRYDDDVRRCNNGISARAPDLYIERDDDVRRLEIGVIGRDRELYSERDDNERRWNSSCNDRVHELYNMGNDDERRLGIGNNDWGRELYHKRNVERRWDIGSDDQGRELYCEVDDNGKRRDYGSNDGVSLWLGNRQKESLESDSDLGRFSGRLGRGVSKGDIIRPRKKNRRVQKKNATNRIQSGRACSWHSEGYKCQHVSKYSSSSSFTCKDRDGFGCLDARAEENRERDQSPMELSISFRSNGLVAKAILTPPLPEVKMEKQSMPRNMNNWGVNSVNDMVKTDLLAHGLDYRSDSQGMSKDLLDKSTVSKRETTPINKDDLSENAVKSETQKGMKNVGSRRRRVRRLRKKRRAEKQLLCETSLNMSKDNGKVITANRCIDNPSVDPQLNSSTKILSEVPDAVLLPSLGFINSEKVDVSSDSYEPIVQDLKRKRSSLTTLLTSPNIADNIITGCPGHAERLVIATEDADDVCQLEADEVAGHASEQPFEGGLVSENAPSEIIVSTGGCDISGSRPDRFFSKTHESGSTSESDSALLQEPENVVDFDASSTDANSKEFLTNQVNIPEIGVTAEQLSIVEGTAVFDRSNLSLGPATSSNFLPADHKGILAKFDVSFLDTMNKKSFEGAIGSPKAINIVKTAISIDYSSNINRKRKCRGDAKANVICDSVSIYDDVGSVLEKDLISPVEVDISGKKDNCKEDDTLNEGPSGAEQSTMDVDIGTDCYSKKRKVISPRLTFIPLSEDDFISDSLTRDCSKLDQGSDLREDILSSASVDTNKSENIDMENKAGTENCYVADTDKTMADVNKLHTSDDMGFVPNNQYLCADGNGVITSNSDDELLASGFDMPDCMSSPEDLLSHTDFCSPINTEASSSQSKDQIICGRDKISDKKPHSADFITFSVGKSLEKQRNTQISQPQDKSKVVPKLNLVHNKLTLCKKQPTSAFPRTFHRHPPINFNSSTGFPSTQATKSRTWRRTGNSSATATASEPKLQPSPLHQSHGPTMAKPVRNSYIRKGNSLVRKPSPSGLTPPGLHGLSSLVYRRSPSTDNLKKSPPSDSSKIGNVDDPSLLRMERVNASETSEAMPLNDVGKSCGDLAGIIKSSAVPEPQVGTLGNSERHGVHDEQISRKKITYVKKRSYQLVAASDSKDVSVLGNTKASSSDGYYKKRKNQLVRSSLQNDVKEDDVIVKGNTYKRGSPTVLKSSNKRLSGIPKTNKSSKVSFVWKLHDAKCSGKQKNLIGPQKVWPYLVPWKRATYRRSFMHALGSKPNNSSLSPTSQKLLLSRKRGAVYTRSTHGYSLRMSKVLSVGGSSLKWSKSIEKNSKKVNEEATRAVAAATRTKKEGKGVVPIVSKSRNHVSRERIFRIGSERYKMDPTRKTLHRITAEEEPSSSVLQSEKTVKRSYVPRRLLIGNDEYVRIGNGNQLVRDPKKRTRVLASEKVKWSLRTARLKLARKRKYCQFFTRFGKCNKDDGKCPYIHDSSKIAVCTKFLNGSCSDLNCKLTHKVIPERMQDCSYFLKGSCSNESCPYRHVNIDPDSPVCDSFLRGFCADGNECQKKHTYVCPAFEATGICPQASTCKLHHPKKKAEKSKPTTEQPKIVRGRYFDGGLIEVDDSSVATTENLSAKGKDDSVCQEGNFPDYISLDVTDDIVCQEEKFPDYISLDMEET